MAFPTPEVDYRGFRIHKINDPQYRHLWYLLFWPIYICRYLIIENLNPAAVYYPVWCPLDDRIPFCEGFLLPYCLWYVFIAGMHLYTALYDVDSYKRYSRFLIISMSISTVIFLVFPTCQDLRPAEFPRDNILTDIVGLLYSIDTNTNVFPSEHAIGALAVLAAAIHTKSLRSPGKLTVIAILAVLICLSTAFLKQHSMLDVAAAQPICAFAYWICYRRREKDERI